MKIYNIAAGFAVAFALAAVLSITRADGAETVSSQTLWYAQPAAKWTEALPVGNGRMGAMIFGGIERERIQFNEDTLWRGKPHDYARPDAHTVLPELRRLIAEGSTKDAVALGRARFLGNPVRQMPYQPFGDIVLEFPGIERAATAGYRRDLDLDNAIATVTYRAGDVTYRREVFASCPAQAIVCRITADKPGSINLRATMTSPHKLAKTTAAGSGEVVLRGAVQEEGVRFEARLGILASGGRVESAEATADFAGGVSVSAADSVTLLLVAGSSYKNFQDISGDPAGRCAEYQARLAADGNDYEKLRTKHVADYRKLFGRVALDLGGSDANSAPTDERLVRVKKNGIAADPALAALHFQYGRYLLISCSRPDGQPANLQGVWNDEMNPPWESKFTTNINFEMNYWPAEITNLSECHEPLFDLVDDVVVSGRRSAKAYYDISPGWVLHHNTDGWRGTAPVNNIDGIWTTGGAWLCHHLWEHYQFTGNHDFLEKRAYPVMREAAQFFMAFLVKDPTTGRLVANPSFSPEQGSLCVGATMDHQIIRALFDETMEAARILGVDGEFAARLAKTRAQLAPNLIGRHGQLQEWMEDVDKPDNNHRHMSPLWALYPGNDIAPLSDPGMHEAAKTLLRWRGDGSTGWSFAWRIPLWARVGDGDMALRQLNGLLSKRTLPNLFDLCGPFQIDGNFGASAGLAEMLLQSHQRTSEGHAVIDLLPALPKVWAAGEVRGLCARGGFVVDVAWSDGKLTRAVIRSKLGNPCQLKLGEKTIALTTSKGGECALDAALVVKEAK